MQRREVQRQDQKQPLEEEILFVAGPKPALYVEERNEEGNVNLAFHDLKATYPYAEWKTGKTRARLFFKTVAAKKEYEVALFECGSDRAKKQQLLGKTLGYPEIAIEDFVDWSVDAAESYVEVDYYGMRFLGKRKHLSLALRQAKEAMPIDAQLLENYQGEIAFWDGQSNKRMKLSR